MSMLICFIVVIYIDLHFTVHRLYHKGDISTLVIVVFCEFYVRLKIEKIYKIK